MVQARSGAGSAGRRSRLLAVALFGLLGLFGAPAGGLAQEPPDDRHAGYYYPEPTSFETYPSRAEPLADSDRRRRIGFTVELAQRMLKHPYPPDYVLFAKGAEAEKMIIVALHAGALDTIYRARAALAQLTLVARGSPLFAQLGVEDYFVFYDLCRLLGFDQITISDGAGFAHQIDLQ